MKAHNYLRPLLAACERQADPDRAAPMAKYMRGRFSFLGIPSPARRDILRAFLAEHGLPETADLEAIARDLWALSQREYQYCAMDLLQRMRKRTLPAFIDCIEHLLVTKSWWDTVDGLASHAVGGHFKRFPHLRDQYVNKWRASEDFWLRRTTLLFQLKYKGTTDVGLLFDLVRENLGSDEFFINKAIGWALREYSKTDSEAVITFVQQTPLAPLSEREAFKWLQAKGKIN